MAIDYAAAYCRKLALENEALREAAEMALVLINDVVSSGITMPFVLDPLLVEQAIEDALDRPEQPDYSDEDDENDD